MACVQCACIKGEYDFTAHAPDCDNLIYQDMSEWMEGEHYLLPKEYEVEVIPPGKKTGVRITSTYPNSVRSTTEERGFKILDGVYCFKVTSCGVSYLKRTGLFPNLECCISRAKILLPEKRQEITKAEQLLESVKTSIELSDIKTAQAMLQIVKRMVDNLKCDCDCCNNL
jgi:hypothetical protein